MDSELQRYIGLLLRDNSVMQVFDSVVCGADSMLQERDDDGGGEDDEGDEEDDDDDEDDADGDDGYGVDYTGTHDVFTVRAESLNQNASRS